MENRITTNAGKADLVIEPRDTEGELWASVQWSDERTDDSHPLDSVFSVTPAQALELIEEAKGLTFANLKAAYLWLMRIWSKMDHRRAQPRKLAA